MTTQPIRVPAPPAPPCALPHHEVGSRVGIHQWHKTAGCMEYLFGKVIEHRGRRVKIAVDQPRKTVISTECGHVFPQVAS